MRLIQRLRLTCRTLALTVVMTGAGCESAGHLEHTWTEDVQLDDGRITVIERHVELETTSALGGGAGNAVETRAVLSLRDERSIPDWEYPLRPLVLYRDAATKEWIIVASTSSCDLWRRRGSPPGAYFEFRSAGGWWKPVDLSPASIGRQANLLFEVAEEKLPEHITVAEKHARQSAPDEAKSYRSIDIEAGSKGCVPAAREAQ
jgi:hypothetical protein